MRDEVLNDGADIKEVAKVLLGPALLAKPPGHGVTAWLEKTFGSDTRTITRYRVKVPFQMPGVFHLSANVKRQGMGRRKVKRGAELFVRDDKDSQFIDVEVSGQGRTGHWFSMGRAEFGKVVRPCIAEIKKIGPKFGWEKRVKFSG